jgi:ribosomal-protein-alanine N-acetyltransferase
MNESWDIVRIVDEGSLDVLVEINNQSFTHPWTRRMFLEELKQPEKSYLLAAVTTNGVIVGYCSVWSIVDHLQINSVAVCLKYRGRGVGLALLKTVVGLGAQLGAANILLEVRRSNAAARALYRRLAFRETGQRDAYYSQPVEDAVILSRSLESPNAV